MLVVTVCNCVVLYKTRRRGAKKVIPESKVSDPVGNDFVVFLLFTIRGSH
jgi:hypothetical protein